jgi:hypothetical protein
VPIFLTVSLLSLALAQRLPQPKPSGPVSKYPHGYMTPGSFCVTSQDLRALQFPDPGARDEFG